MNRTVVHLVAAQPVSRTELADPGLDLVLQCFKPTELFLPSGQSLKVGDHQCAHRGVALCCCDPGIAVDLIRYRDRNILHSFTVTQFPWTDGRRRRLGTDADSKKNRTYGT
jgi:hypothetical protein